MHFLNSKRKKNIFENKILQMPFSILITFLLLIPCADLEAYKNFTSQSLFTEVPNQDFFPEIKGDVSDIKKDRYNKILSEILNKRKSVGNKNVQLKSTLTLLNGYLKFLNKDFDGALKILKRDKSVDFQLEDYRIYFISRSLFEKAIILLEKKDLKKSLDLFKESHKNFLDLYENFPESVFMQDLSEDLAKTEFNIGKIYLQQKALKFAARFLKLVSLRTKNFSLKQQTELELLKFYILVKDNIKIGELSLKLEEELMPENQMELDEIITKNKELFKKLPETPEPEDFKKKNTNEKINKNIYLVSLKKESLTFFQNSLRSYEYKNSRKILEEALTFYRKNPLTEELIGSLSSHLLETANTGELLKHKEQVKILLDQLTPEILTEMADKLWDSLFTLEALFLFTYIGEKFPAYSENDKIYYSIARLNEDVNQLDESQKWYQRVVDGFPNSRFLEHSIFKLGWTSYMSGNYSKSIEFFKKYLSQSYFDQFETVSNYWIGIAYKKSGNLEEYKNSLNEILKNNPYTFYGLIARIELGQKFDLLLTNQNGVVKEKRNYRLFEEEVIALSKAELLLSVAMKKYAARELKTVTFMDKTFGFQLYLLNLFERSEDFQKVVSNANMLFSTNENVIQPVELMKFAFPLYFHDKVNEKVKGILDPFWILSLIRQESSFNPKAVSRANAYGLMQILLPVARKAAKNELITKELLLEPDFNIEVAILHFLKVFNSLGGNFPFIFGAYNAGMKKMVQWINSRKNYEMLEFIESLPYKETRNYIKLITRNYILYNYLYRKRTFNSFNEIIGFQGKIKDVQTNAYDGSIP